MSFNSLGLMALLLPFFNIASVPIFTPANHEIASAYRAPIASEVSTITTSSASSSTVAVTTDTNGVATTTVVHAPYGVRTSVILTDLNGEMHTAASTTPLTKADVAAQLRREEAFQSKLDAFIEQQQKLMDQMFSATGSF